MTVNPKAVPPLAEKDVARFLTKIAEPNERGCRLWTRGVDPRGYGRFRHVGKVYFAHRIAYTLFVGPIPEGAEIDHRCHVHACCTPEHLRPATHKQNGENRAGARSGSASGVRGVSKVITAIGSIRWQARAKHNYHEHSFGNFDTIAEAEAAVIEGRKLLFTHNDLDRVRDAPHV